jgi:manganese/zinc/iron transport system substrate-binding protein
MEAERLRNQTPNAPRYIAATLLAALLLALLAACGSNDTDGADAGEQTIQVVATTGMIADVVRNVGAEQVDIYQMMGPGVDPHLYKATAQDTSELEDADIIFYNGLELEGRLTDLLERLASQKPTIPVAAAVPEDRLREPPEFKGKFDPHIWFDVQLWIFTIDEVRDALAELDPEHAGDFAMRADEYRVQLEELDAYAAEQFETIPPDARVLVTAHDAFGYMGVRYGLDVRGLQGISTASEASAGDVQDLAQFIVDSNVQAIFIESSVPQATIEAVLEAVRAKGGEVSIGGQLFSDAMGDEGTEEGTYDGMVRHNVDTIVQALR